MIMFAILNANAMNYWQRANASKMKCAMDCKFQVRAFVTRFDSQSNTHRRRNDKRGMQRMAKAAGAQTHSLALDREHTRLGNAHLLLVIPLSAARFPNERQLGVSQLQRNQQQKGNQ